MKGVVKRLKAKGVKNIHVFTERIPCCVCRTEGRLPPTTDPIASQHFFSFQPTEQVIELRATPHWTWMPSLSGQVTNLKVFFFF